VIRTISQEDERCPMCNQVFPNVPDHISNVHGIDINLAKWILRLQDRIVSLEAREKK
jgi:hypothetical protein